MTEQERQLRRLWVDECATVSVYGNITDTAGCGTCNLWAWLIHDEPMPNVDRRSLVLAVRSADGERQQTLKKALPLATMAGTFESRKSGARMLTSTGLLCLDMDAHDNAHMSERDWWRLSAALRAEGHCAYFGWSVRKGYFALVAIDYPTDDVPPNYAEKYKRAYGYLAGVMQKRFGVKCDLSCSNVNRLRCLSYDPHAWMRNDITPIAESEYMKPEGARERMHVHPSIARRMKADDPGADCEDVVDQLCERGINVTLDYNDWLKIGLSCASLGESGRGLYHRLSRMDSRYNAAECDKKFNELLAHGRGSVTPATLLGVAKKWGIRPRPRDRFRR